MTTVVSYLTLMTAKNQALVSFGKIALIGEIASILAAFLILPAVITSMDRYKYKKEKKYISDNGDATKKKVKEDSSNDYFCDYQ
jgi:predicted RND superfamily exporter protein